MTKICLLIAIAMSIYTCALSQSCPVNIDFEAGNFSNWQCFTGSTSAKDNKNIISLAPSDPIKGVHDIITDSFPAALDKYGGFPMHCPYGGKYSVRLGNEQTGAQAEGLSYTFRIPDGIDTFNITYFYAVVLQDPNHNAYEQPRFFVTAYDVLTGNIINCASYDYVATGGIPGFKVSAVQPDVLYKTWSPVSIQFAGLAGRNVRLEFKTADCTKGGHFGYAYLDVGSGCSNVLATAPYCLQTNSILLNAPFGFKNYTWYNSNYSAVMGREQSLTLSPPPASSSVFHVDLVPYDGYGCRDTVSAVVHPVPVPVMPVVDSVYHYCQYQTATALQAAALPGNDLLWYTENESVGTTEAPVPITTTAGVFVYYVAQKVLFGCESPRKKITVIINPSPVISLTTNNASQCLNGNKFQFISISNNSKSNTYSWNFGDGTTNASADSTTMYHYNAYGNYEVNLKVMNTAGCAAEKTLTVTVMPNPVAAFDYPSSICENKTMVVLHERSYVPDSSSVINNWWWNINGEKITRQNPDSFIAKGGDLAVKLFVSSANGCVSDTNTQVLHIGHVPIAKFNLGGPLCDDRRINFTNFSSAAAGTLNEYISKWYWQFSNDHNSSEQNPSQVFSTGSNYAKLIVESNYGCRSAEADSVFIIHPKPGISLSINDSCTLHTIKYQASDSTGIVKNWLWRFGDGSGDNGSSVTKKYYQGGYNPVILVGQSSFGCTDTLVRPFTIYENKAMAGRDTIAAKDEPVQLDAHGDANEIYKWNPAFGLSNASIANPVATSDRDQLYQLDALSDKGCESHTQIMVRRYKGPELYIPNAFSPNGDGSNDVLKVFPVGIKEFKFFAVYNRNGLELYKTTDYTRGWDGYFKGSQSEAGAYVAVSQAVDYMGKLVTQKTVVILVR